MDSFIIFFGTEEFSLAALTALVDAGYIIAAVVTKPDRPHGRGLQLRAPIIKTYALDHGIRVLQPEKLSDITTELSTIPNRVGVLSSYGKIIPETTLALFDRGIINVHPSLLPKYRGPSPIETAILNGDTQTGVSIMRLVAKMDAGPVFAQTTIEINETTRARDLYTICAQTGSALLVESLPRIISGELEPSEQDDARATYTNLLNKKDAVVNPTVQTAQEIERHVRAYEEYPRTRLVLEDHEIIVTHAHVATEIVGFTIDCAQGTRLAIDELIAPSGKTMTGAEFQRGYLK